MACGVDKDDGGVGGGQGIDDVSNGLDIQGRRRSLRRRNDRPG